MGALAIASECQRAVREMLKVYNQTSVRLGVCTLYPRQFFLSELATLGSLSKIKLLLTSPAVMV